MTETPPPIADITINDIMNGKCDVYLDSDTLDLSFSQNSNSQVKQTHAEEAELEPEIFSESTGQASNQSSRTKAASSSKDDPDFSDIPATQMASKWIQQDQLSASETESPGLIPALTQMSDSAEIPQEHAVQFVLFKQLCSGVQATDNELKVIFNELIQNMDMEQILKLVKKIGLVSTIMSIAKKNAGHLFQSGNREPCRNTMAYYKQKMIYLSHRR
jgi:hypothetical protein